MLAFVPSISSPEVAAVTIACVPILVIAGTGAMYAEVGGRMKGVIGGRQEVGR